MSTTTETTAPATAAPATVPTTCYTAVVEKSLVDYSNPSDWRKWTNCAGQGHEYMGMMALRRYMRERGGLGEHERSLTLYVYVRDTMKLPGQCRAFVMECTHPADADRRG